MKRSMILDCVWRHTLVVGLVAIFLASSTVGNHAVDSAVIIGVMGDQSGPTSSVGGPGAVLAARLAAEDVSNQVIGRPIQIISADHQNKADIARAIALRWFAQDNVSAIADLNYTAAVAGVVEAARAARKITLISGATAADFTRRWCSPYSTMWSDDTWTMTKALVDALVARKLDTWFFVVEDVAFGRFIVDQATTELQKLGGKVAGSTSFPLDAADFSSYLLQAQQSGAKVIAFGSAGADTINAVKQFSEFGLTTTQKPVTFLTFITDIDAIGLQGAQGLTVLSGFYWNQSDEARAFTERFRAKMGRLPTKEQAAVYASVRHYLAAVRAAGTLDAQAVSDAMRKLPVDFLGREGSIRRDGRVIFDVSLYQVKSPGESKERWDYYNEVARISAAQAYHPLDPTQCKDALP